MQPDFSELQRQLLGAFFEESFEGLEHLESGLLSLGRGSENSAETINDVFRVAHSIKGGAGSFGLHAVGELGHSMETLLDSFRAGKLSPDAESLSLLLEAVDVLRELLDATRAGNTYPPGRVEALCARLTASSRKSLAAPSKPEPTAPSSPLSSKFEVHFAPLPHLLTTGNEPVRLLRELSRLGSAVTRTDTTKLPELSSLDTSLCYLSFDVELTGAVTREQIADVFAWVDGDAELSVREIPPQSAAEPPAVAPPQPKAKAEAEPPREAAPPGQQAARADSEAGLGSIRVSVDRIDLLMNMVGELVITQSMLGELDDGPLDARRIERLREGLGLLARNTRSLQESVMRLRSMPISMVFNRFPRLVHDLSRQLGKQ
ncbi:MAG TPA: Hpt domain-containing protein, partial [Polyangiaceae bacterium]|nr:Hpt domain-containing protein [Polyangiaceae bacterium]